jgi:phospholipase/lecithinase/hemolysin
MIAPLFLCLTVLIPTVAKAGFTEIVAFGDSLSDTGNTFIAANIPPAPYYQGHYSNGPIWLEYLAAKLGVPAPTPSLLGGTNYAWGGAQTDLSGSSFMSTPNIGAQISTFLASHTLNDTQLITLWGGANDFVNNGQTDFHIPVQNLAAEITILASAGGMHFLVPNLPLLGEFPITAALPQATRDALNQLSLAYNADLKTTLDQLQNTLHVSIAQVDVKTLIEAAKANPALYGFTNVTDSAIANGSDGTGYLSWDGFHPTTQAHAYIADAAAFAVVIEPSSMTLMLVAAGCLGLPCLAQRVSNRAGTADD